MYCWNDNINLEDELLNFNNVKSFKAATAFLSKDGVRIIEAVAKKYKLSKKKIQVYLSEEFSAQKPHKLLEDISEFAEVKIVTRRKFHAKVFLLEGKTTSHKVIYGSSNLTMGGFKNNIEFNNIENIDQLDEFEHFFNHIDYKSITVDEDVISYYEDIYNELEELQKGQHKMKRLLSGYRKVEDAFSEDDYDLEDYFFTYEDYETFFMRNCELNDSEIKIRREKVQNKLLGIHESIYKQIKKYGIECHWRKENVTSLIHPMVYNHYSVGWLGIRYGKTKKELDYLNLGADENGIGFQKHGCIQFCIVPSGFEINLFLSVRNESIDRDFLHENFPKRRKKIEKELSKLKGFNMKWEINGVEEVFDFDTDPVEDFYDYYMKNDQHGRESYLLVYYSPDDSRIKTAESIEREIIKYTEILMPLYDLIVFRMPH